MNKQEADATNARVRQLLAELKQRGGRPSIRAVMERTGCGRTAAGVAIREMFGALRRGRPKRNAS